MKTTELLEFDKVLKYLSEYAISSAGVERCLNTPVYEDVNTINHELILTSQARIIINNALNIPLENIYEIEQSLIDAKKKLRLNEEEILNIAKTLNCSRLMRNFLDSISKDFFELSELKNILYTNKDLEDRIFNTFTPAGTVKENATPELKKLYQTLRDTTENVRSCAAGMLQNPDFTSNLQDTIYTQRDGRTVFQVKAECKNKVAGIVHDISQSNQTFFIEPEIFVGLNNKIRQAEIEIKVEIEKILKSLSNEIGNYFDEIKTTNEQLTELDFIFAKAKYSASFDGCAAKVSDKKLINLKCMKNPVLIKSKTEIIENDFYMDSEKNCMIITGSNTGGKTVVLKTAGLCTIMTKAGLHIPCYEAQIYPFKKIYADIGDEQSIIQNLSTFSSHMKNIVNIINHADNETLVLLDEISAGTDPKEGASLAQSILEYLQIHGAFTIATTHYGELKSLAYLKHGFINASVEFNINTLQPSYKLLIGIPGASNAIAIGKNLGLKDEIINTAKDIYFNQKDTTAKVLEELQKTQQELSDSKKIIDQKEENVRRLEQSLTDKLAEIKKEKKKNISIYKKKYETSIDEAREEIKEILKQMREEKSEKIARRSFNRLAGIETALRSDFHKDESELSEKYTPIDWSLAKIGDKAMVTDLNQEVTILSLPDKNKNVQIQMGQLKTKIKQNKLAVLNKNLIKQDLKAKGVYKKDFSIEKRNLSQTLDLRGYRCEEALDELEAYLDKASLYNLSPIYIIHGHGTGALKQVIREYLMHSPYVAKFRPGENAEGGDGVSVADIN
ncbi:MAG: endonuclease MutS2 [Candidatus Gastranaerophilales bacterium]|nr:endonuclease MutS2 [Candidatus Gastranaerophilales bacterium]